MSIGFNIIVQAGCVAYGLYKSYTFNTALNALPENDPIPQGQIRQEKTQHEKAARTDSTICKFFGSSCLVTRNCLLGKIVTNAVDWYFRRMSYPETFAMSMAASAAAILAQKASYCLFKRGMAAQHYANRIAHTTATEVQIRPKPITQINKVAVKR